MINKFTEIYLKHLFHSIPFFILLSLFYIWCITNIQAIRACVYCCLTMDVRVHHEIFVARESMTVLRHVTHCSRPQKQFCNWQVWQCDTVTRCHTIHSTQMHLSCRTFQWLASLSFDLLTGSYLWTRRDLISILHRRMHKAQWDRTVIRYDKDLSESLGQNLSLCFTIYSSTRSTNTSILI